MGERQDIAELFSQIDIAVLCSLREGFSNVVIEAMASGKPIIASNVGGNPEAIIDGETGFLFDPDHFESLAAKAILLGRNDKLREQMGAAARKRAEELFSTVRMVKNYEGIYRSLLANNPTSTNLQGKIDDLALPSVL